MSITERTGKFTLLATNQLTDIASKNRLVLMGIERRAMFTSGQSFRPSRSLGPANLGSDRLQSGGRRAPLEDETQCLLEVCLIRPILRAWQVVQ